LVRRLLDGRDPFLRSTLLSKRGMKKSLDLLTKMKRPSLGGDGSSFGRSYALFFLPSLSSSLFLPW